MSCIYRLLMSGVWRLALHPYYVTSEGIVDAYMGRVECTHESQAVLDSLAELLEKLGYKLVYEALDERVYKNSSYIIILIRRLCAVRTNMEPQELEDMVRAAITALNM